MYDQVITNLRNAYSHKDRVEERDKGEIAFWKLDAPISLLDRDFSHKAMRQICDKCVMWLRHILAIVVFVNIHHISG